MCFKTPVCQVICLVITVILHLATAQSDTSSIETLVDRRLQKFEQKLMEKLQAQNREMIEKQAASFENLECFINNVIAGQLDLPKQMSNIMKENSRGQEKKLDAHATNAQKMAESIKMLVNMINILLAGQLKNQNQLSSLTNDVQRLETYTDQEKAKLNEIHTLLRDTRVQNDQVIAKIDGHAANQMTEITKNLRNIKDDILEVRKGLANVKNDLHSRVSNNDQQMAKSNKNLGNITDNLLAGQLENRKKLPNVGRVSSLIITAEYPSSCTTLKINTTGTYHIRPAEAVKPFLVRCDFEKNVNLGGGWTVFQHRYDGSVDFYRNWAAYRDGFGDVKYEHWLGLEKLHLMTKSGKHELLIILEDFDGNTAYAHYKEFKISSEGEKYKLTAGNYSGTAGELLESHNGEKFSTFDQDNDNHGIIHCAKKYRGGWWFNGCYDSHLNGEYHKKGQHIPEGYDGIKWEDWKGYEYSLKSTKMMLRRRSA